MKKAWGLIIEMVFCALVFTACASLANQGEASSCTGGEKAKDSDRAGAFGESNPRQ